MSDLELEIIKTKMNWRRIAINKRICEQNSQQGRSNGQKVVLSSLNSRSTSDKETAVIIEVKENQ